MRTSLVRKLVPIALVAMACGRGASDSATITDDLRKDLEAASSARPELASASGAYQATSFVSEIEQSNGAAPVQQAPVPRRVAARSANLQQNETHSPAPEPQSEVQVAETPAETPQAPAPQSDVPSVPSVAPRPSALPVDVPSMQGTGNGGGGGGGIGTGRGGEGIGDIIGVVIRGGGVGVDHCPPRRRGRPRFPGNWMR